MEKRSEWWLAIILIRASQAESRHMLMWLWTFTGSVGDRGMGGRSFQKAGMIAFTWDRWNMLHTCSFTGRVCLCLQLLETHSTSVNLSCLWQVQSATGDWVFLRYRCMRRSHTLVPSAQMLENKSTKTPTVLWHAYHLPQKREGR